MWIQVGSSLQIPSLSQEEDDMPDWIVWFGIFFWSGPIGLGVFLAGLGVFYWGQGQLKKAEKAQGA
jgi:hypothetical protein